jgi:hypothetical protein
MHLVQVLLPLSNEQGQAFPRSSFDTLVRTLTDQFGGVTAYTRAPATGLWEDDEGSTVRDDVVVYEVMVEALDPDWWARLRTELEHRFEQSEVVIRAQAIHRL